MKLLNNFIKTHKQLLFLSFFFITLNTLSTLVIPYLLSHMINDGILQNNGSEVTQSAIKMLLVLIVGTAGGLLGSYFSACFASKFALSNRKKLISTIESLTINQTDSFGIASLVTRVTNDNINAQQVILTFLQMILPSPIMAFISIFLTYKISPILSLVPIITIIIFSLVTYLTLTSSLPKIINIQKKMDKMTLVLREFFSGVRIIRAFDNSKREENRTNSTFEDYASNNISINQKFAILTPFAYTLMVISMVLILWFGSNLVAGGSLEIGSITALVEYSVATISTLIMTALVLFQLPKGIASIQRIDEVVSQKSTISDNIDVLEGIVKQDDTYGAIKTLEFNHVNFRYDGAEKRILDDINFSINAGETLAIVGGTGSGKSTIAKVLLRLNDSESGSITINGTDTKQLWIDKLRQKISYIPQKAFIFSGTIRDNFKFANKTMNEKELNEVAEVSQSLEFIDSLPDKFDTLVAQGGTNFSGGQKQRLSIARALSKEADIYIFDDSFSALDYATDAKLRKELSHYLKDKITVIVAQRLSTIMSANKVIVLNDGKIVGEGTHSSLLESNDYYRELAKTQGIL